MVQTPGTSTRSRREESQRSRREESQQDDLASSVDHFRKHDLVVQAHPTDAFRSVSS
jgi:hypothetical protein